MQINVGDRLTRSQHVIPYVVVHLLASHERVRRTLLKGMSAVVIMRCERRQAQTNDFQVTITSSHTVAA